MGRRWKRILLSYIIMMGLFCITLAASAKERGMGLGSPAKDGIAVMNTDFHHARIIPVNSIANDVIDEVGQQRWYAFTANKGRLALDLNFHDSQEIDYAMYLYQYESERGHIAMIGKMSSSDDAEGFVYALDPGIYFVAVSGVFEYDAEYPYTLEVTLSDDDQYGAAYRMRNTYVLTLFSFDITSVIDIQLILMACGIMLQKPEDSISR